MRVCPGRPAAQSLGTRRRRAVDNAVDPFTGQSGDDVGRAVTTQWPPSIGTTLLPNGIAPVNRCSAGVTKMSLRGTNTWTGTVVSGRVAPGARNGAGMFARYRLSPLT